MFRRTKLGKIRQRLFVLDTEIALAERWGEPPLVLSTMYEALRNNSALERQYLSKLLIEEAESWGIEVPERNDWREIIVISGIGVDSTNTVDPTIEWPVTILSVKGRTMITKQIREARLAYWKSWAEILIPILSLVVAIIALLKG
jgi:hypothetical protein